MNQHHLQMKLQKGILETIEIKDRIVIMITHDKGSLYCDEILNLKNKQLNIKIMKYRKPLIIFEPANSHNGNYEL